MAAAAVNRRQQKLAMRLLRALLVSLALAVVITPPVGAALMREASGLVAEPASGTPPPARPALRRITAVWRTVPPPIATCAAGFEPAPLHCAAAVRARNILLLTNRILC